MKKFILFPVTVLLCFTLTSYAQKSRENAGPSRAELKFLDDITIEIPTTETADQVRNTPTVKPVSSKTMSETATAASTEIEKADNLQFKYAVLMDTEVEEIRNLELFGLIDDWYGTRYKYGGTTKSGIDCSALMQKVFTKVYGIDIPRTAKEQYKFSDRVSRTALKEGDLVFFNTRGGVSHVGLYLGNNKFLHASTSGVTISDLFDSYYAKRFIGVGRIAKPAESIASKP